VTHACPRNGPRLVRTSLARLVGESRQRARKAAHAVNECPRMERALTQAQSGVGNQPRERYAPMIRRQARLGLKLPRAGMG